jgi:phosphoglycerate dehydrogenase-like enzyme
MVKVINQYGPEVSERIRAAVPGTEVIDVPGGEVAPDGVEADALFTWNRRDWAEPGGPIHLCERHGIRWVQLNGAGAETITPELCADGRIITTGRTAGSIPISEFVLASMLAFAKRFPLTWIAAPPTGSGPPRSFLGYDESEIRWGPPTSWNWAPLVGLAGKTLGLIGFGGIAQATAQRALGFDMHVVATRRHPVPSPVPGVEMIADVRELIPLADHLVLAVSLTPATRHLLNDETLALVKRGVHIVNISRGAHIDNDALRRALDDGRVAFASLDVHDPSPLPAGHWLYGHPHVHVSPHVSWMRQEGPEIVEIFIDNLRAFADGEPLKNVYSLAEGY